MIKTKKWFGFRLHLIADATYELPVAFSVTKASNSEKTETEKLLDQLEKEHEKWMEKCKYFLGDKGYDSSKIIGRLEDKGIHSIIDIRNCWKDGEETHQYKDTLLVYNYKGNVWYVEANGKKLSFPIRAPIKEQTVSGMDLNHRNMIQESFELNAVKTGEYLRR